jgi:CDP-diacylglycerol--glycerol-3-phosphate 3-phosphatidyltransferase
MAKILSGAAARRQVNRVANPLARVLLRLGISPDAVTVAGTVGVLAGAGFAARGRFVIAVLVVTAFALTDLLDGAMARLRAPSDAPGPVPGRRFGALLDSTMDRIADGAIFGAIAFWYATGGADPWSLVAALICLVAGQVVSYVKARAQGLGMECDVGIAERAERLVLVGLGTLATGLGLPAALPVALWLLAVLSMVTVGQRIVHVYRADRTPASGVGPEREAEH